MYDLRWLDNEAILQLPAERLMFYSLIFAMKPKRYLEIGSGLGGSAMIATGAMDASQNEKGTITCVDDHPEQITGRTWRIIRWRARMVKGKSPDALAELTAPFDFVFIDGDHRFEHVAKDISGVIPLLAPQATIVFHDAFYVGVKLAVDLFVKKYKRNVVDVGLITTDCVEEQTETGPVQWGGLRLVKWTAP